MSWRRTKHTEISVWGSFENIWVLAPPRLFDMNQSRLSAMFPAIFSAVVLIVAVIGLASQQWAQGKVFDAESPDSTVSEAFSVADAPSEDRAVADSLDFGSVQDSSTTENTMQVVKQEPSLSGDSFVGQEIRIIESDSVLAQTSSQESFATEARTLGDATLIVRGQAIQEWVEVVREGDTVETWMRRIEVKGLDVEWREFADFGGFVYGLEGLSQSSGSYWLYAVNGRSASRGVSGQEIHPSDVIEWFYE